MADQAPSGDPPRLRHRQPQQGARGVGEAAGSGQLSRAAGRHHGPIGKPEAQGSGLGLLLGRLARLVPDE